METPHGDLSGLNIGVDVISMEFELNWRFKSRFQWDYSSPRCSGAGIFAYIYPKHGPVMYVNIPAPWVASGSGFDYQNSRFLLRYGKSRGRPWDFL